MPLENETVVGIDLANRIGSTSIVRERFWLAFVARVF